MDAFEEARFHLLMLHPFFATLFVAMRVERVGEEVCATCATDGEALLVNPEFLEEVRRECGIAACVFVLAHEVAHAALCHPARRGRRDPSLWNIAADHAANLLLMESGLRPPSGKFAPLADPRFRGMAAEEVYALLERKLRRGAGFGQAWGDHSRWTEKSFSRAEAAALDAKWRARLSEALRAAKLAGKLPAGLERLVKGRLRPQVDWRAALASFAVPSRADYSWRPDRRAWPSLYLPDLEGEAVHDLVVAVDTSGSVSQEELDAFAAELRGILASYPEVVVHVLACDAAVHSFTTVRFSEGDPFPEIPLLGGGGTDFRPVFEEVRKRVPAPAGLVYLTDGCGAYPERSPAYPVLWVLTPSHAEPPWGAWVVLC